MIMPGQCQCGCGQQAPLAKSTHAARGRVKGQPVKFIKGHNVGHGKQRHPRANANGYVLEHLLVAERALGRPLSLEMEVHHVNEITSDNRGTNLVICEDLAYHKLLHRRMRAYRATGNPNSWKCKYCKQWGLDLYVKPLDRGAYHPACANADNRARKQRRKA